MSWKIRPVVMSGGAGTRLWPLSRLARPKQFHEALGPESLFRATLRRVDPSDGSFLAPIILASQSHEATVREELDGVGVAAEAIILEPVARNTAPAVAAVVAFAERSDPATILVVLPADHAIVDSSAFAAALKAGAEAAAAGRIVTFGIRPDRPETGYGYIRAGVEAFAGVHEVAAFTEKPAPDVAAAFLASGDYFWNAGIFMFRPDVMAKEFEILAPETIRAARRAVDLAVADGSSLVLDRAAFETAEKNSIDYAVMEKTRLAAVKPIDVGWSDVGSWQAVWAGMPKDEAGNAYAGPPPRLVGCRNVLSISDGPTLSAIGMSDVMLIAAGGAVLVLPHDRSQDVRDVVELLKKDDGARLL